MREPFTKPTPKTFKIEDYRLFTGQPERRLKDGDTINVGDRILHIIHTPGHICIFEKKTGYLFGGDHIYKGDLHAFFESTEPQVYAESVKKLTIVLMK